jgi:ssDNA-binding Zn-finger/Zn-ribbon topoisomerase 1
MSLKIDKEFRDLIPPLTSEEKAQLEENLVRDGCIDPLLVWNETIIDGHNRYEICTRRGVHFDKKSMQFNTREEVKEWIILNQFGRRNLTPYQRSELALKLKPLIQAKAKENQFAGKKIDLSQNSVEGKRVDTQKELAKIAGVSHDTIFKVEQIQKHAPEEVKQKVKSGEISIRQGYLSIKPKEDKEVVDKPDKLESSGEEVKKCNACGMAKHISEFRKGKAICLRCDSYKGTTKELNNIKIDGDQIFREITEIGTINPISHSYIVSEVEEIINKFSTSISDYTYKKQAFESLNSEERQAISTSLTRAESWINQIKKLLEV